MLKEYKTVCSECKTYKNCVYYDNKPICENCYYEINGYPEELFN